MSVTFLHVGSDKLAWQFLQLLDDKLTEKGAKYDIVDSRKAEWLFRTPIEEMVYHSLHD